MQDFKQYVTEKISRDNLLANTFQNLLRDANILQKSDIDKIISKVLFNDVPYYKQPKSTYKDYNAPKMRGFDRAIENLFNQALNTVNKAYSA